MTAFEVASLLCERLEEEGLDCAIGGALALTAWAIPRDTKDVDLSIFITPSEIDRVFAVMERAGILGQVTSRRFLNGFLVFHR